MPRLLPTILLTLLASGCGALDVTLQGTVRTPLLQPAASSPAAPIALAFDRLGNLTLNGRLLDLPQAREEARYGVTVVDAGALPALWRPAHASDGGLLVAALDKASPLAIRGLRPFDRLLRLDGESVGPAPELIARLAAAEQVRLEGIRPDGTRFAIEAAPERRVGDHYAIRVPFLFERRDAAAGAALGLGPMDLLGWYRRRVRHLYVEDPALGHTVYRERFEWGALGNLLLYERERDPLSGEERSRLRLLWLFSFGDDLDEGPR